MLYALFLLVVVAHGLIHLLGYAKYVHLAALPQLSGKTVVPLPAAFLRTYGFLWLTTCLMFLFSAVGSFLHQHWWPLIAGIAIVLSQGLIFVAWTDAKFGTWANVLVLFVALPAAAEFHFERDVNTHVQTLISGARRPDAEIITAGSVSSLPEPVRRWLKASGAVGSRPVQHVHLTQRGQMRPQPGGDWIDATAEQHFSVDPPGFVWSTSMEMMPLVRVLGEDHYADGHGRMLITVYGLFTINDATGDQMDQGTALRYLAEICWFPTAALSPYITWEPVDSATARATLNYQGLTVSGTFTFNEAGDVTGFSAERYMDREGGATLERWVITMEEVKDLGGYRIPVKSSVTWRLKEGDNTWFRLEVESIEYR